MPTGPVARIGERMRAKAKRKITFAIGDKKEIVVDADDEGTVVKISHTDVHVRWDKAPDRVTRVHVKRVIVTDGK